MLDDSAEHRQKKNRVIVLQRRAGNALFGIAALQLVHVCYAMRVAIPERLVVGHLIGAFTFITLVLAVTVWIAFGVRGGRRTTGGILITVFFFLSSVLSMALGALSKWATDPGFVIFDAFYAGWCIVALWLFFTLLLQKSGPTRMAPQ